VDASYVDPGCNGTVVSTFEWRANGQHDRRTISASDARHRPVEFQLFRQARAAPPAVSPRRLPFLAPAANVPALCVLYGHGLTAHGLPVIP